jgi:hypothetical protein
MFKRVFGVVGLAIAKQTAMEQKTPMTGRNQHNAFGVSSIAAAARIAVHLKAAGYSGEDIKLFCVPEHPKEQNHPQPAGNYVLGCRCKGLESFYPLQLQKIGRERSCSIKASRRL